MCAAPASLKAFVVPADRPLRSPVSSAVTRAPLSSPLSAMAAFSSSNAVWAASGRCQTMAPQSSLEQNVNMPRKKKAA